MSNIELLKKELTDAEAAEVAALRMGGAGLAEARIRVTDARMNIEAAERMEAEDAALAQAERQKELEGAKAAQELSQSELEKYESELRVLYVRKLLDLWSFTSGVQRRPNGKPARSVPTNYRRLWRDTVVSLIRANEQEFARAMDNYTLPDFSAIHKKLADLRERAANAKSATLAAQENRNA